MGKSPNWYVTERVLLGGQLIFGVSYISLKRREAGLVYEFCMLNFILIPMFAQIVQAESLVTLVSSAT